MDKDRNIKTEQEIIEKIQKLLALSDKSANSSDAEAEQALLRAQELMSKYNISDEKINESSEIKYAHEICHHKWDMGFRKDLAQVIAGNFRCRHYLHGKSIVMVGHPVDARIAREAFEFAYEYAMRGGNKQYNKAYQVGRETRGVFNSYVIGFIKGLKDKLDEQSTALMIITPPDVKNMFDDMTKDWKQSRGGGLQIKQYQVDGEAFNEGIRDGRTALDNRKIEE